MYNSVSLRLGRERFDLSTVFTPLTVDCIMFSIGLYHLNYGTYSVYLVDKWRDIHSNKGREGFYKGIVNSHVTIGRMLVDQYGMQAMVFVLTAFMIVPIFTRLLYDRPLKQAGYELGS